MKNKNKQIEVIRKEHDVKKDSEYMKHLIDRIFNEERDLTYRMEAAYALHKIALEINLDLTHEGFREDRE